MTRPERLWLDLETYSDVPITHGTHAYARQAQIMLFAWALDDGPAQVWDRTSGSEMPPALYAALADARVQIWAHNSHFDRTVLGGLWHTSPLRWRDSMVLALMHGLPGSLGQLCDILRVPFDQAKDKEGRQLVNLFCKPRPKTSRLRRATRETHPQEWAKFVDYARLDIDAMRAVYQRLPEWNAAEWPLWHLDQRINDRGVAIDLELVHAAIAAVEQEQKRLAARAQQVTGGQVQSATRRAEVLQHALDAYGVSLPDLQKSTLERRLQDAALPPALHELLALRLDASSTSVSKYKVLARATSEDGRLRGTLQFCGASRTGRWAGRLFQPQNLPRPALEAEAVQTGIDALKAGCADLVAKNVIELASSALRGCIEAPAGSKLVCADLSNIEGRMLAWLAGESWKLQAFAAFDRGQGPDLYKLAYARAFAVRPEDVTKAQRQIGKVMELMLGYEGGVGAFLTGAATYGIDLDHMAETALPSIPAEVQADAASYLASRKQRGEGAFGLSDRAFVACDAIKRLWRQAHARTASFWPEVLQAARNALSLPGERFDCRRLALQRDGAWLRIRLPSGRLLCYPGIALDEDGTLTYMGVNPYSRRWERLKTYGGKLVENITQAAARDVLAAAMPRIEQAGYRIVLTVHDEVICEAPDIPEFNPGRLSALLAANPPWADGLPLAAAGFEAHRYRKD